MRFVDPPRLTKVLRLCLTGITLMAAFSPPVTAQPPGLVVSVAASIHDALAEIAGLYRAATGVTVALNTGGSNTLARQIVEGAPVGLFLSADDLQMDVVEKAGRLVPGTRTRLLTNELAVVVPHDAPADFTLERLLEGRVSRLAMGEPSAVPPESTAAAGSRTRRPGRSCLRRWCRSRRCAPCCLPLKPAG